MTYKFKENLLIASKSNDFSVAINEWFLLTKEIENDKNRQCICQRHIKKINWMFNFLTLKQIIVGDKCIDKFNLNMQKLSNKMLEKCLNNIIYQKGIYTEFNIFVQFDIYTNQFIECINKKNIDELIDMIKDLKDINLKYKTDNMNNIILQIEKELNNRQKTQQNLIKKEKERIEKEKEDFDIKKQQIETKLMEEMEIKKNMIRKKYLNEKNI